MPHPPRSLPYLAIPPKPDVLYGDVATDLFRARYEDISQDGRVMLPAMLAGLGGTVWKQLISGSPIAKMSASGVVPILRRLVFVGEPGSFSVMTPLEMTGRLALAHEPDGAGGAARIFLHMWLDADAPHGSTFGPRPDKDAPRARAGTVFAEDVLTRLFAPKEERRVTRLDVEGLPPIPENEYVAPPADELGLVPPEAEAVGEPVERAWTFSMSTTDSNQHVNSLVYPRLFEELAFTHLRALGLASATHLARQVEVRWRKPFFAGDAATIRISAFRDGDHVGATGLFLPAGSDRPSAGVRMLFEP